MANYVYSDYYFLNVGVIRKNLMKALMPFQYIPHVFNLNLIYKSIVVLSGKVIVNYVGEIFFA